jgi:hypothetical protein
MLVNAALIFTRFKDARTAGWLAPIVAGIMIAAISGLYLIFRPQNVTEESLASLEQDA